MKYVIAFAVLAAATTAIAAAAPRPVLIGRDGPEADACGVIGTVTGLNPHGNNYLSVRASPNTRAAERDRLRTGQRLYVCSTSADENWLGVVYRHGPLGNCGVTAPVQHPRPYGGPCRWGWVSSRYVDVNAG
ncbi:MAG: hypothetical protein QOD42_3070 [Sphingomonadales bacterium]|jgi:hypothetical protein|nr:hypothetical protein [Sphingomonadales bacterium]